MMDFSLQSDSIPFRVDGDVFYAVPEIPGNLAFEYIAKATALDSESVDVDEKIEILKSMIRMVLKPASAARFIDRLSSTDDPIGAQRMQTILSWLFEQYGDPPTESDSDSSTGSERQASGTPSTATT